MAQRNQEKRECNDQEIFHKEVLEDVFFDDKDGFWRYIVSMGYINAESEIRKRNQGIK